MTIDDLLDLLDHLILMAEVEDYEPTEDEMRDVAARHGALMHAARAEQTARLSQGAPDREGDELGEDVQPRRSALGRVAKRVC